MGVGSSKKVSKDYYDTVFGYDYGKNLSELPPPDLSKAVYIPDNQNQLPSSQLTSQSQTGGGTRYFYEEPDVIYYGVPVRQQPKPILGQQPAIYKQPLLHAPVATVARPRVRLVPTVMQPIKYVQRPNFLRRLVVPRQQFQRYPQRI